MFKLFLALITIVGFIVLVAVIVSIILFPLTYSSIPNIATLVIAALFGVIAVLGGFNSAFELATKVLANKIEQTSGQQELDRKLFAEIRNILSSDGTIRFVRNHDYGGSFEFNDHKGLFEFLEFCENPEFEFFDSEMEDLRKNLEERIRQFRDLLDKEVFPVKGSSTRVRLPRDPRQDLEGMADLNYLADGNEQHFQELLAMELEHLRKARIELNELASQIYTTYDKYVRVGRKELGA